jgi:hypothetical protein
MLFPIILTTWGVCVCVCVSIFSPEIPTLSWRESRFGFFCRFPPAVLDRNHVSFPAIFLTVVYLFSSHINDWLAICAAEGMIKSPGDTRVVLSFMPPAFSIF